MAKGHKNTPANLTVEGQRERHAERLGQLAPTANGLLLDWNFLQVVDAVVDERQRGLFGVYRLDAAGFLLTPLLVSCIVKVWILLFDSNGDAVSLPEIAVAIQDRSRVDYSSFIRNQFVTGSGGPELDEVFGRITECTRYLKAFRKPFGADRTAFAAHVIAKESEDEVTPVDYSTLLKIVPKAIYLKEQLGIVFGLPSHHYDNVLRVNCQTASVLFGLEAIPQTAQKVFAARKLGQAEFEAVVEEVCRTRGESDG
jgi:hypothetical protein